MRITIEGTWTIDLEGDDHAARTLTRLVEVVQEVAHRQGIHNEDLRRVGRLLEPEEPAT